MPDDRQVQRYQLAIQENHVPKPRHCLLCHEPDNLDWHGCYPRSLITWAQEVQLLIKRLFCKACRHTFACLPDFIVKFRRYAKSIIRYALKQLASMTHDAVADELAQAIPHCNLSTRTLYFWQSQSV